MIDWNSLIDERRTVPELLVVPNVEVSGRLASVSMLTRFVCIIYSRGCY